MLEVFDEARRLAPPMPLKYDPNDDAHGFQIRAPRLAEVSGLYSRRGVDSSARDRGQHRHLQRRPYSSSQPASVRRAGRSRSDLGNEAGTGYCQIAPASGRLGPMSIDAPSYRGYRFPPEIISHAVWLYHRFRVSFRDVENMLAERGVTVSYEAIRLWCIKFGPEYARRLKRRQGRLGDAWHLDEVFVTIQGQATTSVACRRSRRRRHRHPRAAASRPPGSQALFSQAVEGVKVACLGRLVTDKLRSYSGCSPRGHAISNPLAPSSTRIIAPRSRTSRRGNVSGKCESFKSPGQAQRFLSVHGLVQNLFRVRRHLLQARHHRELRGRAFHVWDVSLCAA